MHQTRQYAVADIRRQIGQYKRLIREQQEMLRWIWVFWALPIPFVFMAFFFDWHWFAKAATIFAVVTGAMTHADVNARIWLWQKKIDELEQVAGL